MVNNSVLFLDVYAVTVLCFYQYNKFREIDETYTIHMGFSMSFSKKNAFLTIGM